MRASHDWLSHQLSEFLAVVSAFPDEATAIEGGAERLAEAVEAEVVAVVIAERIVTCLGFAPGDEPTALLLGLPVGGGATVVPDIGEVAALVVPLEEDPGRRIVLLRAEASFSSEEVVVLRGMVRTLGLTLRLLRMLERERTARRASELQTEENKHLVASLRERQELLERLFRIQRSISHRAPLAAVFEAITEGAAALLDAEVVALRLLDPEDHDYVQIVSSIGVSDETIASIARSRVGVGIGGRAVSEERLVIADDYQTWPHRMTDFEAGQLQTAIAAPVYRDGKVAGSLTVATYADARRFTGTEQEMLLAFAQHTSLALNDASALLSIQRAYDDAMNRATHDELTGLPNRALVLDRLAQALAAASRADEPLCLLFVDLDRFKTINDSLGHPVGDEVLVQVAQRLRLAVRPSDTVGRLSGDEFVVICEQSTLTATMGIADRVARAIGRSATLYGRDVTLTASVGVAVASDTATGEEILRDADVAMYRAKERGRARIEVFDETIRAQMLLRIEMEQELRRAITAGDLRLHYQPIVDGRSGDLTGLEALVRWQHPQFGLLYPDVFIPLAEDAGLIIPLGRWVVEDACRQVATWRREGSPLGRVCVSVNLSARQFADIGLLDMVIGALDAAGIPGSAIGFEITESVLMEEADAAVDALRRLKELGCHLAIDDFGTGYSSLSYLQSFPVDTVKIDRSFVNRLVESGGSGVIIDAVVGLARALGLGVVAEGVETTDQLEHLHRLGCDTIQGYLFSRPRPPDELETASLRTATGVTAG